MNSSNTRAAGQRQHHSSSTSHRRQSTFCFCFIAPARMPPVFNIIRACVYLVVLVWTIICLAIAVHLQGLLITSDLTRFVPFAIFVCSAGLAVILTLLVFGLKGQRSPITTRIELGCLGLIGTFWLALGAFLATSESEAAEVECFSSASSTVPLDNASFSTETYHAQYRVLEAFSLFNVILIWGFLLVLLALALRQHFMGENLVWYCPVTAYPWFTRYSKQSPKSLPSPVTAKKNRKHSKGNSYDDDEKDYTTPERRPSRHSPRQRDGSGSGGSAQKTLPKAHTTDRYNRHRREERRTTDKFARDASPRR